MNLARLGKYLGVQIDNDLGGNSIVKVECFDVKCGDITIKHVTSVKYLGVQIDNDLGGNSIVKGIISKVNSRVKFLYKYKDLLNFESRKNLCSALIQCLFDYSCSSWYPGCNKDLLQCC